MSQLNRLKDWCRHAFAVEGPSQELSAEDHQLIDRLADFLVRRRLSMPALLILDSSRPLTFLGAQMLTFLSPFATLLFSPAQYQRFTHLLEHRANIEVLINAIVAADAGEKNRSADTSNA
ncbi:MAG: hypothetical protein GKR89_05960 [Candidatus Latescibacteria bacterium]|nr:hypothetical protein [Candidatus Latescibacterota bacterium]